ncbi:aminobutyraldehyde dehydrogenase [Corynebacterium sp. sy039]|uniref:aminobutyraldehyde dehydrogenase n=1 Tax=Corynebacterium sp. sy039 TaxID=2599641 RepID=UPI0011B441ED|nr:aminobutyraldehyde dehydrogenase [Corynebacterium sp. sy039]QDZ43222.1 aldehyde dehydrogenase family protein [Corynebacterium sp. sy039]
MHSRYKNFVDNQFVTAHSTHTLELVSPVNEQVIGVSPISNEEDVNLAVAAAKTAWRTWRNSTPSQRQKCLLKLAELLEENARDIAVAQSKETGQIINFVETEECLVGADQLRFFASAARILSGLSTGEYMEGFSSSIRREPVGVIAQVAPWNYPLMMALWKIAPAVAAGNTVVFKPSDTTPGSSLKLAELIAQCFPPGVINIVLGDATTGTYLTKHPDVDMVSITGSVSAGRAVGKVAGENLKRSHLELGGKAPVIVCADADLVKAAEGIAAAGLFNAGQDCTAATRVLVEEEIAQKFIDGLVSEVEKIRPGQPEDAEAFYGSLNNKKHFDKVMKVLAELPDHAHVLTGGKRWGEVGYYVEPTVIAGLKQNDSEIQEEIFGPIITVQTFSNFDHALELANDVKYGLASSVWSSNNEKVQRASRELDFGCVWANAHIPLVAEMPHGGFKESGYGKDLSVYAVEEYTRIKHVMIAH